MTSGSMAITKSGASVVDVNVVVLDVEVEVTLVVEV